jgi:chemotaxis protein CheX
MTTGVLLGEAQIVTIVREVWASFLGTEAQAFEELTPLPGGVPTGAVVTGTVTISGAWQGSVLLAFPIDLAARAASEMYLADADVLSDDEICDAVGELTNMIGGTIKSMLPGPSHLSIPTVATGAAYELHVPGALLAVRAFLGWRGEALGVTVWQGTQR